MSRHADAQMPDASPIFCEIARERISMIGVHEMELKGRPKDWHGSAIGESSIRVVKKTSRQKSIQPLIALPPNGVSKVYQYFDVGRTTIAHIAALRQGTLPVETDCRWDTAHRSGCPQR